MVVGNGESHPIGGVDYPRTAQEFESWFPNQQACIEYLQHLRWPDGFRCPGCGGSKAWLTARGSLYCGSCNRQTSVIAGTIFQGTRKPLRLWFQAMWYVTSQKSGTSALGLKRVLGLGSYQTAWSWLHKLRRAMVRPGRDRLRGYVEIDETYVGGVEKGKRGRGTEKKAVVAIAVEMLEPKGFGRVRMRSIADVSGSSLVPFVCQTVEPGTTVHTDGWKAFDDVIKFGYDREITVLATSGDPAHVLMPGVHRVAALLKRWLLGTHQGAVTKTHLDYYLVPPPRSTSRPSRPSAL